MFRDGSWWFVMICGGSWWFLMVRGGLWWFVMIYGGSWCFFSRERSCDPLFNQSESQIHYQLSFLMRLRDGSWWFIRDGFVVVHDGSWWFVMFYSLEKGHVTLFSINQRPKFTMKSHFWWDFVFAPFHLKSIPLKSSAKNETEPIWLSPVFAIFQAPPCKVIHVNYAYNHIYVKPTYNKQR